MYLDGHTPCRDAHGNALMRVTFEFSVLEARNSNIDIGLSISTTPRPTSDMEISQKGGEVARLNTDIPVQIYNMYGHLE